MCASKKTNWNIAESVWITRIAYILAEWTVYYSVQRQVLYLYTYQTNLRVATDIQRPNYTEVLLNTALIDRIISSRSRAMYRSMHFKYLARVHVRTYT